MSMVCMDDKRFGLEIGNCITEDVDDVFSDAVKATPVIDTSERAYISLLPGRVRRGELDIYTLMARCRTVGVICYRSLDGDVELVFGHVLATAGDVEGYFLERIVADLLGNGAHTVRSNFTWPEPDGFIGAARGMGFLMTERMSMGRRPAPAGVSFCGFEVLPWDDARAPQVCRIMFEDPSPADRPVYPMFSTPEGARMLIDSVLNDRHGKLLRVLSCVACSGGATIGFLLSTMLSDGSILILNIAVAKNYRRMGVGAAMLDRLIGDAYLLGYTQILLAVTMTNHDAIRLYERKGFKANGYFRQYVLTKVK